MSIHDLDDAFRRAGDRPRFLAGSTTDTDDDAASAARLEANFAAIEAELEDILTRVKGDDEARERFLALLEELGPENPATNTFRRRLATALF